VNLRRAKSTAPCLDRAHCVVSQFGELPSALADLRGADLRDDPDAGNIRRNPDPEDSQSRNVRALT